jgi:hypothetical protein
LILKIIIRRIRVEDKPFETTSERLSTATRVWAKEIWEKAI